MHLNNSLRIFLFIAPVLFFGCSNTETEKVTFDTDLSEYGLDTLQLRTLNSSQFDSLANHVHQNIKEDFRMWRSSRNSEDYTADRNESYFADKLYGYYLTFPESEHRIETVKFAFAIWATSGLPEKMETVLNEISLNKDYWSELAAYYHLYHHHLRKKSRIPFVDSRKREAYLNQLSAWNSRANNEKTRTHLNFYIAEAYFWNKEYQMADTYLLKVLELTRDSIFAGSEFTVDMAQAYYNEIHSLQIGAQAPVFSAASITGKPIDLSKYHDKVVLLVFWSTTCGHSLTDMPNLRDMYSNLGSREDFVMIGVSQDTDIGILKIFKKEHDLEWEQINDNGFGEISVQYSASYTPRTYVIDKKGKIAYKNLTGRALKRTVTKMLE